MSSTIDAAGRIVIPKSVRDAMGLRPGIPVDVLFSDGRIQIEFAPVDARVVTDHGLPSIETADDLPALTDEDVRATLETTRR